MFKIFYSAILVSSIFIQGCTTKNETVIVNENDKYGLLKSDKEIVIKPIFDELSILDDRNNKNQKLEHPNLLNLHWIHDYKGDEYSIVKYKEKYGIINTNNQMVVKPIYDSISRLFNGFFIIKIDDKYGFLNDKYEVVQKPIFKAARDFLEDITFVQLVFDSKWKCIDKNMNLSKDSFDEVYNFNDNFARIVVDNKWGFIDNNCKIVIEPKYNYAYNFSNNFAKVIKNNKTTFINTKGIEVVEPIFNTENSAF